MMDASSATAVITTVVVMSSAWAMAAFVLIALRTRRKLSIMSDLERRYQDALVMFVRKVTADQTSRSPATGATSEQVTAEKRRRHSLAIDEWDLRWDHLSSAGRSQAAVTSAEVSEQHLVSVEEQTSPPTMRGHDGSAPEVAGGRLSRFFPDTADLLEPRMEPGQRGVHPVGDMEGGAAPRSSAESDSSSESPGSGSSATTPPDQLPDNGERNGSLLPADNPPSGQQTLAEPGNPTQHARSLQLRFHADVVQLLAARMASTPETTYPVHQTEGLTTPAVEVGNCETGRQQPGGSDDSAILDPGQILGRDPRTMWAWSEYQNRRARFSLPLTVDDARRVLSAIPPGDHVEIFGGVSITRNYPERRNNALPREAKFAARTFHCWILPSPEHEPETIPATATSHYSSVGTSMVDDIAESHFSLPDDRHFYAYSDGETYDRFDEGAGRDILRLPDSPLVPAPPEIGTTRRSPSSQSASHVRMVGDWRTAEEVALWHMSGPLGFFGSRLTGGVSDRGVDVEHPQAVAQVKMQANPVGAPLIRQLRGARPQLRDHIFYSTSGYTRAAKDEASESGVALFILDTDANVRPSGAHAARLILDGHRRNGGDDAVVAEYVKSVTERVRKAHANYGSMKTDSWLALQDKYEDDRHQLQRAEYYLKGAMDAIKRYSPIGAETNKEVLSHFRNADLRAAYFCQVLALPYPGEEPLTMARTHSRASDFY